MSTIRKEILPGDVISFTHYGWLGVGINLATLGVPLIGLSHMAIATQLTDPDTGLKPVRLAESTTLAPQACCLCGEYDAGFHIRPMQPRLCDYPGAVWHYPLSQPLSPEEADRLEERIRVLDGAAYDKLGAFRSRATGLGWLTRKLLRKEDLRSLFCSEVVMALLREVDRVKTDNASQWSPNSAGRALLRWGVVPGHRRLTRMELCRLLKTELGGNP